MELLVSVLLYAIVAAIRYAAHVSESGVTTEERCGAWISSYANAPATAPPKALPP